MSLLFIINYNIFSSLLQFSNISFVFPLSRCIRDKVTFYKKNICTLNDCFHYSHSYVHKLLQMFIEKVLILSAIHGKIRYIHKNVWKKFLVYLHLYLVFLNQFAQFSCMWKYGCCMISGSPPSRKIHCTSNSLQQKYSSLLSMSTNNALLGAWMSEVEHRQFFIL